MNNELATADLVAGEEERLKQKTVGKLTAFEIIFYSCNLFV
jgi:hypothetical protein